jgi:hypothetical protein
MMKYIYISVLIFFTLIIQSCSDDVLNEVIVPKPGPDIVQSPPASGFESTNAIQWMSLTYEIVAFETIPAPVCSRLYGYSGIAIYESVYRGIEGAHSLSGQLKEMPEMPSPENKKYDWLSVMAATLKIIVSGILYEPTQHSLDLVNDLYTNQIEARKDSVGEEIVNRSVSFGEQIGNAIIEWSNSDNFLSTRNLPYEPPSRSINPAYWEPTLPGQHALEPFLRFQRPFCLTSANMCAIPLGFPFDTIPGTSFYNEGMEVLEKVANLTTDEMNIAFFWEDKSGTGQPPGHWVSITNIAVSQFALKLDEAAKVYALVGSAIRDAFISCWEAKYRVNLLRPKTYIRDYLGEPGWNPIVVTPPFPEYTSGHSVVSGAVSYVLTWRFGDNVAFTDSTHGNQPGLRNRDFTSFYNAADEAAWSRLYGGIHYRSAILNGIQQGRMVGQHVFNTINF